MQRQATRKSLVSFLRRKGWLGKSADSFSALKACLAFLSSSRARFVLVNLEDLWQETNPQNVPSTTEEYPNWRRKARQSFENFCQTPEVTDILSLVDRLRKRRGNSKREH